jgi:thiamine-phosphate diphosphorylase
MSMPVHERLRQRQLCLVIDPSIPDLKSRVSQALAAGVTMVQVRGHQLLAAELYELTCELCSLCQRTGALCIVNDRIDVGLAAAVDGFQLGRRSLPLLTARRLVSPAALLGASVHSLAEASTALAQGADFLLVGTMFASSSHPGETPAGPRLLTVIREQHPDCMMLGIGGITPANAAQVIAGGAHGIAVVSSILQAANIAETVQMFRQALALS